MFGKRAEALGQYLTKGQAVTVSGTVSQREYTDKDGNKKTSTDVRVNDIALQGGKREQEEPRYQAAPEPKRAAPKATAGGFADMDSDVPFNDPMANRAFAMSI